MQACDEAVAGVDIEYDRRITLLGEVWAAWGRGRDALRRMLNADIRALKSGPELLGMVFRHARRHYIFVNDRLPRVAPILERVVLAHEAVHVVRGVDFAECCHPALVQALQPAEWETWVQTGFMLIPERYGQLWMQGWTPEAILDRYDDGTITPGMVKWRGLMEIAQGKAPGCQVQALADADAMLRDALLAMARAAQIMHDQEPEPQPERVVSIARRFLVHHLAALMAGGGLAYNLAT